MKRAGLVVAVAALCLSLLPMPAARAQSNVNFTRFVGVGDSLTAGFKDGALFAEGQNGSFYVHVADSMNTQIVMPLIASPGIPTPNPVPSWRKSTNSWTCTAPAPAGAES